MAGRSEYLDFSKGMLILLVVIGHSIQYVTYQQTGFWNDPLFKTIYMFHMPLFMAISGYVSTPGLVSAGALALVRGKASSYLTPVLAWGTLYLALLALHDGAVLTKTVLLREFLGRLWFLWALFGSVVLIALARTCSRYWAGVVVLMFAALLAVPDIAIVHLFKYTFPFFVLGHVTALAKLRAPSPARLAALAALTGLASVACFALWNEATYIYVSKMALTVANLPNIALRYVAGVVVSIFALCVFHGAWRLLPAPARHAMAAAGRDTLYIYVVSMYGFILAEQLSKQYLSPPLDAAAAALVSIASGCIITAVCWLIGRRIAASPAAARLLFGKRTKRRSLELEERTLPDERVT
ncbi:acyltransferase family protein [Massilia solisilvae]|uniref:Acyltransferase family protein n=1 Tax=Massilia solisilvae TaxID=1811225 RepID=A0ABT2BP19_9BURK|nr:acyltransferase family protein [Massilia solisilvae]MCS0610262.1 acyltransferase family protein [Massilia solisilvae]